MDAPMDSPEHPPPPPARPAAASARAGGSAGAARSSSPSPTAAFTSAKMLDAQGYFQRVVKQELQVLLANGVKREDAVRMLLHRIVESTEPPEPAAVRSVMRQFQMNYDDAVRALIVKQELGRLKRKGMDSFAAIEELTRKMQRIPVPSDADAIPPPSETPDVEPTEAVDESSGDKSAHVEEASDAASVTETKEDAADNHAKDVEADATEISTDKETADPDAAAAAPTAHEASGMDAAAVVRVDQDQQHADEEEAEKDVEKQLNLSSLTLCQRIDKVSISSAATRASLTDQPDDAHAPSAGIGDAGVRSPRSATTNSSANASTPPPTSLRHARKRRAPFGFHGRSNSNSSDGSISPERHVSISSSLSSLSHDLYPSVKKQKMCEVGDGFMSMLSRKAKNQTPPESPAASDSDTKSFRPSGTNSTSTTAASESLARASSKNLVKRPRSSLGVASALMAGDSDDDSPILEHDDVLLIRHLRHRAKRHKSSSSGTGSATSGSATSGSAGGRLYAQPARP